MEILFITAILVLGAVAISAMSHSSHVEQLNERLREQNEVLREMALERDNDGIGCGTILGLFAVAALLLAVAAMLGLI